MRRRRAAGAPVPYPTSTLPEPPEDAVSEPEPLSEPEGEDVSGPEDKEGAETVPSGAPTATVSSGAPTGSSVPSSPKRAVTTPP
ncbi:hypothetical protein SBADM41S_00372 [Streptomyces badius]